MHTKKISLLLVLVLSVIFFERCSKTETAVVEETYSRPVLPATAFNYAETYPDFIMNSLAINDNTPADNLITNDGATLGRVLFYDKNLSANKTISCSSCHSPQESFSDNDILSKGFDGGLTARHSMPLLNVRFYKSGKMFWDERSPSLEKQVLQPIQNAVEMGLTLTELETRVKALDYYPSLFQKAFGSSDIDSLKISKALAQFVRSIVTYKSKYDFVKQGLQVFTADEATGEDLFLHKGGVKSCAGCHAPPMFLTSSPVDPFALLDPNDHGINNENRFKVGSLRNIVLRSSLFHNGSVSNAQNMLNRIPGGPQPPIPAHSVTPEDAQKLFAFLSTLTDESILTEEKFGNPFE